MYIIEFYHNMFGTEYEVCIFIIRLQGHSKELRYIISYEGKSFSSSKLEDARLQDEC